MTMGLVQKLLYFTFALAGTVGFQTGAEKMNCLFGSGSKGAQSSVLSLFFFRGDLMPKATKLRDRL